MARITMSGDNCKTWDSNRELSSCDSDGGYSWKKVETFEMLESEDMDIESLNVDISESGSSNSKILERESCQHGLMTATRNQFKKTMEVFTFRSSSFCAPLRCLRSLNPDQLILN